MKLLVPLVLCACAVVAAQNQESVARFSSRVQLVEVYASVIGADGAPVMGLRRSDFQVYEDARPQELTTFVAGEFPLTVALGVDRSFSMAGEPLRLAKLASQTFLRQLKPGDRSMVVAEPGGDGTSRYRLLETLRQYGEQTVTADPNTNHGPDGAAHPSDRR